MTKLGLVSFVVLLVLTASIGAGVHTSTSALWDEESASMTFEVVGSSVSVEPLSAPSSNHSRRGFDPAPAMGLVGLNETVTNETVLNESQSNESATYDSIGAGGIPAVSPPTNGSEPESISDPPNGSVSIPANGTPDNPPAVVNPGNGTIPLNGTDTIGGSTPGSEQTNDNLTAPSNRTTTGGAQNSSSPIPTGDLPGSAPQNESIAVGSEASGPSNDSAMEAPVTTTPEPIESETGG